MATAHTRVKGNILITPKGKSLFVSVPAASSYDESKQEASILLSAEDMAIVKGRLQDFLDSAEVKESGIKDTGFVDALFKEDTDADGNVTGLFKLKAKTGMQYPCKLYTASGDLFTPDAGFHIPNRSDIKMSVKPEVMSTAMFTGLVLRLQAIKIINLPSFDDGLAGSEDEGSFDGGVTTAQASAPSQDEKEGWD